MKKYTFKEFLKGEFSILVNKNDIEDVLNGLSQTSLRWASGDRPNQFNPFLPNENNMCFVVEFGELNFSRKIENYTPLIRFNQMIIEDDDLAKNYFIGQCVKSENERLYSVGELYYFRNGVTVQDDGKRSWVYLSIEDFNNENKDYFEMVEIKEVEREARVGEFVKIVNAYDIPKTNGVDDYKNRDILKIIDSPCYNACYSHEKSSDCRLKVLHEDEYVVLEGYKEIENLCISDIVKVTNPHECFNLYDNWFEQSGHLELKNHHVLGKLPIEDKCYKIVGKGPHNNKLDYPNGVYAIQDPDTTQVFLMDKEGIKKVD